MRAPLLCLVLLALPARADTWEDPELVAALSSATCVVIARAPAEGSSGRPVVRFQVEKLLHERGGPPPPEIEVGGLHDPGNPELGGPSFEAGERVLFILQRGPEGRLVTPTPTFGRFPLRGEKVLFAALRDTNLRLELPLADYEQFLLLALGRREAGWLEQLGAHLKAASAAQGGAERSRLYLALEAFALAGVPDVELARAATRCLEPTTPFQLRVSALRALAAVALDPLPALLQAAERDPEPAVRSAALGLLRAGPDQAPAVVERLVRLLPDASPYTVRFTAPTDPRTNAWPSPRLAAVRAIDRLGAAAARPTLIQLVGDDEQPADVFLAALEALARPGRDPALARQLAGKLRAEGDARNEPLVQALELLTGETRPDVAAWKAWSKP